MRLSGSAEAAPIEAAAGAAGAVVMAGLQQQLQGACTWASQLSTAQRQYSQPATHPQGVLHHGCVFILQPLQPHDGNNAH